MIHGQYSNTSEKLVSKHLCFLKKNNKQHILCQNEKVYRHYSRCCQVQLFLHSPGGADPIHSVLPKNLKQFRGVWPPAQARIANLWSWNSWFISCGFQTKKKLKRFIKTWVMLERSITGESMPGNGNSSTSRSPFEGLQLLDCSSATSTWRMPD